jgi:hypothetical protein
MRAVLLASVAAAVLALTSAGCVQEIKSCTPDGWIASNVAIYTEPAFETLQPGDTYTSYTSFTLSQPVCARVFTLFIMFLVGWWASEP